MLVIQLEHHIDRRIDHYIAQVIDQEDSEEDNMVLLAGIVSCRVGRKEQQRYQRQPCNYTCPSQELLPAFKPFTQFIKEDEENKNDHTELKKETHLVTGSLDTLDENIFIQGEDTKDDTFNSLVSQMQTECLLFIRFQVIDDFPKSCKHQSFH
jgi:hypothetical protein